METFKLECGYVINYETGLDGGGTLQYPTFTNAVLSTGRRYTRAHEWCAGLGIIGFDLLGRNICNHIVFTDIYQPAIENCQRISIENGIQEKVTCYVSDSLDGLPATEKWDLVVANPPHAPDKDVLMGHLLSNAEKNSYELTQAQLDDVIRITLDENFESHKKFFRNVNKHLLDGADVFFTEVTNDSIFEELAAGAGLKCIAQYPAEVLMEAGGPHCKMFHFRKI